MTTASPTRSLTPPCVVEPATVLSTHQRPSAVGSTIPPAPTTLLSLAAIQGLHAIVKDRDGEIARQQEQISELSARLERLEMFLIKQAAEATAKAR